MGRKILKSKRALLGLTQVDIASKLGINIKSYNLKENGKVKFKLEEVVAVSKILNLTLDEVDEIFLNIKKI
ncbi:helix-turn-helix transcriptional regulator [Romboutsia sp. CE17]|uniref:helix-turn-helix transcriptional regulator n=1 Tax=Romboutsia sp. CE17 TaxID=2724150 RepID=UPI001442BB30|nr:helix-turn-helix transcriptional regulator [Romboutsia sp. CE17]QJA07642.1 helix-turn-helix transcriptional regulator [Romboutsia sp. CE17]